MAGRTDDVERIGCGAPCAGEQVECWFGRRDMQTWPLGGKNQADEGADERERE